MTLEFPSPSPDFTFYLDYLLVTPEAAQTLTAQDNFLLYAGDSVIQASMGGATNGWTNMGNFSQTSVSSSQFTLQFTGSIFIALIFYAV